jgi:cytochrome c553
MNIKLAILVMFVLLLAFGIAQAGGDATKGQALSADCSDCHGANGMGDDETPALAGMEEAAFVAALQGYASGEIEDESGMMADYVADLSAQDMADLAAYYASLGK